MYSLRYRTVVAFLAGVTLASTAAIALQTWRADAAPGDRDATFVPISPCRILDTRPTFQVGPRGNPLGAGETHTVDVHAGGTCTIPTDAVGLSLNVTTVGATLPTFVTIWPDGTRPDSSSLNPFPGQPPTPNAVTTDLSATGGFNVYNLQGTIDVIIDVNGYYTHSSLLQLAQGNAALQAQVDALRADVAVLETLTASMSLEEVDGYPVVRFTGVNVQVVNGSGNTDGTVNALGNLIVGYHENSSDTRTGSHNLIVGPWHSYSSNGGFLAGADNTVIGLYSSVSGGWDNTAIGLTSSVSGGAFGLASATYASVSGGAGNTASGRGSSVSGGLENSASGEYSSVSGGVQRWSQGNSDWRAGSLFEDS